MRNKDVGMAPNKKREAITNEILNILKRNNLTLYEVRKILQEVEETANYEAHL